MSQAKHLVSTPNLITNGGFTGDAEGWEVGAGWEYDTNKITFSDPGESEDLVSNGDFAGNANGWTLGTAWSYASNHVQHVGAGTSDNMAQDAIRQDIGAVDGLIYRVRFTISGGGGGNVGAYVVLGKDLPATTNIINISSNGTHEFLLKCDGTNGILTIHLTSDGTGSNTIVIDDVSCVLFDIEQQLRQDVLISNNVLVDPFNIHNVNVSFDVTKTVGTQFFALLDSSNNVLAQYNDQDDVTDVEITGVTTVTLVFVGSSDYDGSIDNVVLTVSRTDPLYQFVPALNSVDVARDYKIRMKVSGSVGSVVLNIGEGSDVATVGAGDGVVEFTVNLAETYPISGLDRVFSITPSADFNGAVSEISIISAPTFNEGGEPVLLSEEFISNGFFISGFDGWYVGYGWTLIDDEVSSRIALPQYAQKTQYKNTVLFTSGSRLYAAGASVEQMPFSLSQHGPHGLPTIRALAAPFGVPIISSALITLVEEEEEYLDVLLAKFSGFTTTSFWKSLIFSFLKGKLSGYIDYIIVRTNPLPEGAGCTIHFETNQDTSDSVVKTISGTGKTRHVLKFAKQCDDARLVVDYATGSTEDAFDIKEIQIVGQLKE